MKLFNWEAFSIVNRQRCESSEGFNHKLESWSLSDWGVAMMGEGGEACNIIKKLNRYRDGIKGNKELEVELKKKLASELADTFIYLDLLAQAACIDLQQAVIDTFNKKSIEIDSPIRYYR
jgi:NTP pyrophosphatase (non-canonical NTP hydrolase)